MIEKPSRPWPRALMPDKLELEAWVGKYRGLFARRGPSRNYPPAQIGPYGVLSGRTDAKQDDNMTYLRNTGKAIASMLLYRI